MEDPLKWIVWFQIIGSLVLGLGLGIVGLVALAVFG